MQKNSAKNASMNSAQEWTLSYERHFVPRAPLNTHIKPHFSLYSFHHKLLFWKPPNTALFSHVIKLTSNSPVGTAPNLSTESLPCLVALAWGSAREPEIFNHDTFHTTFMMQRRKSLAQAAESAWAQVNTEERREPHAWHRQGTELPRGLTSLHLHFTNTLNFLPPVVLLFPEI